MFASSQSMSTVISESEGKFACLEHLLNQAEEDYNKKAFWVSRACYAAADSIYLNLILGNEVSACWNNYSNRLKVLDLKLKAQEIERELTRRVGNMA